jgi:arylsulfatase A-like enzyme
MAGIAGSSAQPNVVVIVMDTVRADHFSVNGYERDTTPNLKVLARDSTVYTQAIAPSDMTLTSHASLFTGMYPSWHGAYCQPPDASYGRELAHQVPTLAEILSKKGFSTVGVAANLYLRADFGLQRGFESFRIPRPVPVLGTDEGWYLLRVGMRRLMIPFTDTSQFDRLFSRGEDINREMFKLLNKQGKTPFFAFLNYMDAHFPYIPPAPFNRLFPGKIDRIVEQDLQDIQDKVMHGEAMPSIEKRHLLSQYDGGIAYTDAQIGEVMNWLKKRHLYDNSLIVVTSDHGEGFGEKNLVLHGNSVYQNLVHVALLIKFPKAAHTGVVNDPVSLIDVAPTIVNVLGYAPPANMQGKNLLDKAAAGPRQIFSESFQCPVPHPPECPDGCMSRSVLAWPYKLVTSSSGKFELYDVSNDAGEDRNLAVSQSAAAKELGSELSRWVKTMPPRAKQQLKLDGEAVQKLKSLGYVQ